MNLLFYILGAMTITGAAAAMSLRNIVHCVLALTIGFVGLALLFLQLGAQFVGFTQVLVYVGAVAILAVFVIMMTQSSELKDQRIASKNWATGLIVAVAVFGVLARTICSSSFANAAISAPDTSVARIGTTLMHEYALPLEIVGLLLTAALIGAVIVAMPEKRGES